MRESRDAHLESDARDATESFGYVKDFSCHRCSVTDEEGAGGAALRIELGAGGGGPAAFLAYFGEGVGITWEESFGGFGGGVCEKADGVEADGELLGGMSGATTGFAVEINEGAETDGLAADDGDHERKSEHAGADEGFGSTAYTDPYGEGILERARVDGLAGEGGPVIAGPVDFCAGADFEEEIEFFGEEFVVIFEAQAEQRVGLDEGAATGDDFGAAAGD